MPAIKKIKIISFDLDDALYDNRPVLFRAEQLSRNYLQQEFEKQKKVFDFEYFLSLKQQLLSQNIPELENMNVFRQTILTNICAPLVDRERIANRAFEIFLEARSQAIIDPLIESALHQLAKDFTLVTVTNGNCDATKLSIGHLFESHYSPLNGYRAKPHPQMLQTILQQFQITPRQLVHVGDSLEKDGMAARNAGVGFVHFAPFLESNDIASSLESLLNKIEKINT